MAEVYKYKRVGIRKIALVASIAGALGLFLSLRTISETETIGIISFIPSIILIGCCSILLYTSYRKSYVSVEDGVLNIVGTKIPASKMKKIDVNEKRIDIIVAKGTFLLGTHIYMTDACFYNTQDWNNYKQDIENLKTLVNQ